LDFFLLNGIRNAACTPQPEAKAQGKGFLSSGTEAAGTEFSIAYLYAASTFHRLTLVVRPAKILLRLDTVDCFGFSSGG
jgi:hypothetical protein